MYISHSHIKPPCKLLKHSSSTNSCKFCYNLTINLIFYPRSQEIQCCQCAITYTMTVLIIFKLYLGAHSIELSSTHLFAGCAAVISFIRLSYCRYVTLTTVMPYRWAKKLRWGLRELKSFRWRGRLRLFSSDANPPPAIIRLKHPNVTTKEKM